MGKQGSCRGWSRDTGDRSNSKELAEWQVAIGLVMKQRHCRGLVSRVSKRNHFERRCALVEGDVLAALELGLTIEELCTISGFGHPFRKHFGTLSGVQE